MNIESLTRKFNSVLDFTEFYYPLVAGTWNSHLWFFANVQTPSQAAFSLLLMIDEAIEAANCTFSSAFGNTPASGRRHADSTAALEIVLERVYIMARAAETCRLLHDAGCLHAHTASHRRLYEAVKECSRKVHVLLAQSRRLQPLHQSGGKHQSLFAAETPLSAIPFVDSGLGIDGGDDDSDSETSNAPFVF